MAAVLRNTGAVARHGLAFALLSIALAACSGDDGESSEPDVGPRRDVVSSDTDGPSGDWEISVIEAGGFGKHVNLDVRDDGTIGVAYYSFGGTPSGPCPGLGIEDPPEQTVWPLHYAELAPGAASWVTESVVDQAVFGNPSGIDFLFGPDGSPTIASTTGQPVMIGLIAYCGSHNAGFYTRSGGTWNLTELVMESGTAATGEAGSDFGTVVGNWPAMAFDSGGQPALAYRDVHSGSIQSDDMRRADLEFSWQGRAIPVDIGRGAGIYTRIVFDSQNRPNIAYYIPTEDLSESQLGVWVTRSSDQGATWEMVKLFNTGTSDGPDPILDADGNLAVVLYHSGNGRPQLVRLPDESTFADAGTWDFKEIGDTRYDEGYSPSLALSPSGRLAVAYYRCTRSVEGLGECNPAEDAVVFAYETEDGSWKQEVVDPGDTGLCGTSPALGFDSDGHPVIAYGCQWPGDDGRLDSQVRFARRDSTP
jgi:hypothetical protein